MPGHAMPEHVALACHAFARLWGGFATLWRFLLKGSGNRSWERLCGLLRGGEAHNGSPHWLVAAQNDTFARRLSAPAFATLAFTLVTVCLPCLVGGHFAPGDVGFLVALDDVPRCLWPTRPSPHAFSVAGPRPWGRKGHGELAKSTCRSQCCQCPPCSPVRSLPASFLVADLVSRRATPRRGVDFIA